jgi:hypothetical protein
VSKLEKTKKKCRKLLKEKFKVGKPESQWRHRSYVR